MAKNLTHTVGLDVGTSRVTCIIGEPGDGGLIDIIGIGESESKGLRKGVVVDPEAAVESITRAVEEAERMSGIEVDEVAINLSGSHIMSFNGQAIVAVSGRERDPVYESGHGRRNAHAPVVVAGRDREITQDDVRRAIESASAQQLPAGREIVDRLPQEFIVDDQDGINDPVGMIGARLAVKVHIVTSPVTARQNAINAVNRAGLVVADMVWERQLSSGVVLTGGGALLHGMTEIAEQVFDAPVRIGYPERDRFGGLVEDVQSPAWTAAAGLALLAYRTQAAEIRTGVSRRGSTGKLTHFVSRFKNRFGS